MRNKVPSNNGAGSQAHGAPPPVIHQVASQVPSIAAFLGLPTLRRINDYRADELPSAPASPALRGQEEYVPPPLALGAMPSRLVSTLPKSPTDTRPYGWWGFRDSSNKKR